MFTIKIPLYAFIFSSVSFERFGSLFDSLNAVLPFIRVYPAKISNNETSGSIVPIINIHQTLNPLLNVYINGSKPKNNINEKDAQ